MLSRLSLVVAPLIIIIVLAVVLFLVGFVIDAIRFLWWLAKITDGDK